MQVPHLFTSWLSPFIVMMKVFSLPPSPQLQHQPVALRRGVEVVAWGLSPASLTVLFYPRRASSFSPTCNLVLFPRICSWPLCSAQPLSFQESSRSALLSCCLLLPPAAKGHTPDLQQVPGCGHWTCPWLLKMTPLFPPYSLPACLYSFPASMNGTTHCLVCTVGSREVQGSNPSD